MFHNGCKGTNVLNLRKPGVKSTSVMKERLKNYYLQCLKDNLQDNLKHNFKLYLVRKVSNLTSRSNLNKAF